jgi:prolyl 4-hydroxylase
MVFLEASEDLVGGGTNFLRLRRGDENGVWGKTWCAYIECGKNGIGKEDERKSGEDGNVGERIGVTFKAIAGNAIFWENFDVEEGVGYEESYHAGMPVKTGTKIGLNIWSWYQRGLRLRLPNVSAEEEMK